MKVSVIKLTITSYVTMKLNYKHKIAKLYFQKHTYTVRWRRMLRDFVPVNGIEGKEHEKERRKSNTCTYMYL